MPVSEEYEPGKWRPARPEPFYVGFRLRKSRCECGQVFKSRDSYREHWHERHSSPADRTGDTT